MRRGVGEGVQSVVLFPIWGRVLRNHVLLVGVPVMTKERVEEIRQFVLNICNFGIDGPDKRTLAEDYLPELFTEMERLRRKLEEVRKAAK